MATAPRYEIHVGKEVIDEVAFLSFVIERDMFQPDMVAIVINNQGGKFSKIAIAEEIDIKVGDDLQSIYKGEVVGLEATYKGGEKTTLLIRGMNKLHRLLRHRKSVTFTDKTDEQILKQVVGDADLKLEWKHAKSISYKHVYQHNQTDMEFLRTRAARLGCHVWCVDNTVYVKEPELQGDPLSVLRLDEVQSQEEGAAVKTFRPRLSSASILKKVTVKGWNPETKELIIGDYSAQPSKLGNENAVTGSKALGGEETFTVDHPIWSKEEAVALAKARLVDLSLTYITGECELTGDQHMELGKLVHVEANSNKDTRDDDPFNGKYYIMGVTHRYVRAKGSDSGFVTVLRLARDAQKSPPPPASKAT
ncbi:MAG TPA: contractile injection system protein, VgrG/Pvc8 family [Kofleriaceae bacterium]